jgi:hypothetical protein
MTNIAKRGRRRIRLSRFVSCWLTAAALIVLPQGGAGAKSYTLPPEVSRALQSLMSIAPGDCPDEVALDPAVATISGFLDQQDEALTDFVHSMPDAMLWHAAAVWRQGDLARAEREMAAWLAGAPAEHEGRAAAEADLKLIRQERDLTASKIERPQSQLQVAAVWQEESTPDHRRVAVIWRDSHCLDRQPPGPSELDLYGRDAAGAGAKLGDAVTIEGGWYADFGSSTGADVNGDGLTDVVLSLDNGGNCWTCSHMRVFGASRAGLREYAVENSNEVSDLQDLNGDGRLEALAIDGRWEFLPYAELGLSDKGSLCHACSPGVFIVMSWRDGRYKEGCRDYSGYYQSHLAEVAENLKQEKDFDYYLGGALETFATLVQMGQSDEALKSANRLLTSGPFAKRYKREGQTVVATLKKSLRQSAPNLDRACPFAGFSLVR